MIIRKPKLKFWTEETSFWILRKTMDPQAGLADRAESYEIDWPFRVSNSWVLHLPRTAYGVIIGRWKTNPDFGPLEGQWVDEHLERAIKSTYGTEQFQADHFVDDDSDVIPPKQD